MSERILEVAKFLVPLLGVILGALIPSLIGRFLPTDGMTVSKWGIYVFVGVGGTLGGVLVDYLYTGNINYWWGAAGFFMAACICWIYMQYFAYPFKRFRVTRLEDDDRNILVVKKDGKGLIAKQQIGDFDKEGKRWVLGEGWGVWGPYFPLGKGWFSATFRIKVTGLEWERDYDICEIDVVSWPENWERAKFLLSIRLPQKIL